jgi:2-polyprenyl-3-methyl-5-hydroxy-6-metoxy-1,4-benzoquinol methylase
MAYKKLNYCLCCNSKNIIKILDLGKQPLANSYIKNKNIKQIRYPLAVNACIQCSHLQLTHIVDPKIIYKKYDYLSGTTSTYLSYMKDFYKICKKYSSIKKIKNVIDIGCNDGSQLDIFKNKKIKTYGVDPAKNIFKISSKNHKVYCSFFTSKLAKKISKKFDIIISQNSFAHNPNPCSFLKNAKKLMHEKSTLLIQTSQANMCANKEFDTIYHEHVNFFNMNSMNILVRKSGLYLHDVIKKNIHGTSYIFIIKRFSNNQKYLNKKILNEKYLNINFYKRWSKSCFDNVDKLKKILIKISKKYIIIGYGAAAKSNTFLNFSKIKINFIIDDNILKQNKFTPGSKIPIYSIKKLEEYKKYKKIYFLPLAWNFFDEIKEKIQSVRKNFNDSFIKYHPKIKIFYN